jgi:hypothetical protein
MSLQSALEVSLHEQALLNIVRTLPVERVLQILDFARYVQTQTLEDFALGDDETAEEVAADEARWDAQFVASQDGLKKMADRIRAEIQAGQARAMVFTKDGRIVPG